LAAAIYRCPRFRAGAHEERSHRRQAIGDRPGCVTQGGAESRLAGGLAAAVAVASCAVLRQRRRRQRIRRCAEEGREEEGRGGTDTDTDTTPSVTPIDGRIWAQLGVPAGASKDEMKKKFKLFVRQNHPDVVGTRTATQAEVFTAITTSYKAIMKADDDLFWLESFCAKVEAINQAKSEHAEKIREERYCHQKRKFPSPPGRATAAAEGEGSDRDVAAAGAGEFDTKKLLEIFAVVMGLFLWAVSIAFVFIVVHSMTPGS